MKSNTDTTSGGDRIKSETQKLYDAISPDFDLTRSRSWPETVDFVKTLEPPGLVLDLGCGNGRDTILLKQQGFSTVSVDISAEQCSTTRKKLAANGYPEDQDTRVVQGDCEDLEFEDGTFHGALFIATLHHLSTHGSRIAAVQELKRVMKPGAKALISVWDFAQPRFKELFEKQMYEGKGDDFDESLGSTDSRSSASGKDAGRNSGDRGTAVSRRRHRNNEFDDFGDALIPWKATDGGVFERFYHLFIFDEFKELMDSAGFHQADCSTVGGNHFARVVK